jgi:N5-(cytidine 5'-diphosphoramidyl)-L-glutamine hydrolase
MPLRIGLTQRMEWIEARDEMREILDVAWSARLVTLGALPVALYARGLKAEAALRDYGIQLLLLTGGNESGAAATDPASRERNAFESELLRVARTSGIPVLGVCHGMQIMNLFLGGRVSSIAGHVRAPHALGGPAAKLLGAAQVNTFHETGIRAQELAPELLAVGTAPDCSIEAAVHRNESWLGVMWHPERAMPQGADGMAAVAAFLRDPAGLCRSLRAEATR